MRMINLTKTLWIQCKTCVIAIIIDILWFLTGIVCFIMPSKNMVSIDVQIWRLIFPSLDHTNSSGIIPSFQLVNDQKNTWTVIRNNSIENRKQLNLASLYLFWRLLFKDNFTFKIAIWNMGWVSLFFTMELDDLKHSSIASLVIMDHSYILASELSRLS